MRVYVEFARVSFQVFLTYRAATLAGLTTNAFFGALRTYLFLGLYGARGEVAGWSAQDAVDFVWISQALIMPINMWLWLEVARTVRTGDVATDLAKPYDFLGYWLARDAGRALYQTCFRFAPTIAIGGLLFGVRLPLDLGRWASFAVSLALAVCVSFALRFLYNSAAFWLLDERGASWLSSSLILFLSGFVIPLNFFPTWARDVLVWLPFAAVTQVPGEVLLGKYAAAELLLALGQQAFWAGALLLLARLVLLAATRKLVVQGG